MLGTLIAWLSALQFLCHLLCGMLGCVVFVVVPRFGLCDGSVEEVFVLCCAVLLCAAPLLRCSCTSSMWCMAGMTRAEVCTPTHARHMAGAHLQHV